MPVRLKFEIKKLLTNTNAYELFVTSMTRLDTMVTYGFPDNLQHQSHHQGLFAIKGVKNYVATIVRTRNVNVTPSDELFRSYFDEDENAIFRETPLDEKSTPANAKGDDKAGDPKLNDTLVQILQKLST